MGSTVPDFTGLAKRFNVHESVIENMYEEYEFESEVFQASFDLDVSFEDYLIEEFAEAYYMIEAIQNNGTAMDCLEAYDNAYLCYEND